MVSTKSKNFKIMSTISIIIVLTGLLVGGFYLFHNYSNSDSRKTPEANTTNTGLPYDFDYNWVEKSPYIAHAFGGINGDTYTNSYEAFLLNYQLGHRIFEVDFSVTDDNRTVLAHDADHWRKVATVKDGSKPTDNVNPTAFTYDNFMSSLWYDIYHTLDIEDLLQIMKSHPDIYIVTDTKYSDKEHVDLQFSEFVKTAQKVDESLLDRFIPQIYNPEMLGYIMDIYPWKSVIYTLYANPSWTPDNVLTFANESGVKFITIHSPIVTKELTSLWHSAGLKIATHTDNNLNAINELRSLGADFFYTDFLIP